MRKRSIVGNMRSVNAGSYPIPGQKESAFQTVEGWYYGQGSRNRPPADEIGKFVSDEAPGTFLCGTNGGPNEREVSSVIAAFRRLLVA